MLILLFLICEEKACAGKTTYVHCKAGRGRSTTVVLCYLVCVLSITFSDNFVYSSDILIIILVIKNRSSTSR